MPGCAMLQWVRRVWAQMMEPPRLPDIWADDAPPDRPAAATLPPTEAGSVDPTEPSGRATRRSVWQELADDPGAAALRARWEARWDEF